MDYSLEFYWKFIEREEDEASWEDSDGFLIRNKLKIHRKGGGGFLRGFWWISNSNLVEIHRKDASEFQRIPWNSTEVDEIPWDSIELHRTFWNSMEFYGLPWNSIEIHGIPWNPMGFHGIPCNTWKSMESKAIPWNSTELARIGRLWKSFQNIQKIAFSQNKPFKTCGKWHQSHLS